MSDFLKSAAPAAAPPDPIDELREKVAELCTFVYVQGAMITELQRGNAERDAIAGVMMARIGALERNDSNRRTVDEERVSHRPPGNWTTLDRASYKARKSKAWIFEYRRRGLIPEWEEGTFTYVDLDKVLKLAALTKAERRVLCDHATGSHKKMR